MDRVVVVYGDPRWPRQFKEIVALLSPFAELLVVHRANEVDVGAGPRRRADHRH